MSSLSAPFYRRHIGPAGEAREEMLRFLGFHSLDELADAIVPAGIRREKMALDAGVSEAEALREIKALGAKNKCLRSLIGQGYFDCEVPAVIARNILENPAWYTAYTPYQPEISQGRLEALLNFQTMVADLTAMEIANASMLDEATAAAEAMMLAKRSAKSKSNRFLVDSSVYPQTLAVIKTRAQNHDIEVVEVADVKSAGAEDCFGALLQYPASTGGVADFSAYADALHANKAVLCVASDLLALCVLKAPGEMGADIVVGNSQRFGVPLGFGGPHAAFMATRDKFKRNMPGRVVGVSKDRNGKLAYRLALQTREQHIRREKATSNICTAQALLAVMAGAYGVYHGPDGLKAIAKRVHGLTTIAQQALASVGMKAVDNPVFDTLVYAFSNSQAADAAMQRALDKGINLRRVSGAAVGVSFDEKSTFAEVAAVVAAFAGNAIVLPKTGTVLPAEIARQSAYLTHPVFNSYHSETEMMRYLHKLADWDLALDRTMIPLGSCTMKLNAASEMFPMMWPEFADIHPFAPASQTEGYRELFASLEKMLCEITGYDAVSLQPNSGAAGEYAGLLSIRAYLASIGEGQRNICLIPSSAHGTNPASAHLAGMDVVVVACDDNGNIDLADLQAKAEANKNTLAAMMVTYPSTHGVFEADIKALCQIVHDNGGQVYIDGANLNAQVGLAAPGLYGGDVSHLNLHKTFAIPHGGGGPGVGPIGVKAHLAPFLPGHNVVDNGAKGMAVSAAPWGSALVDTISWMYIRIMGAKGLTLASETAVLNANYIAKRLAGAYPVLYTDAHGYVAHECIIDVRGFKESAGISVNDIAKRLIDFGFHAPTMSFPVPGTLMIEPTESEPKRELDRFCEAMLTIREEIRAVEEGKLPQEDNPLVNAPHVLADIVGDWAHPYSREEAVFPVANVNPARYFPPVARIDDVYGDRHVFCTCPPIEMYEE